MSREPITINKTIQRRFILGKQGLYPGRRWHGKSGVLEALRSGCVIQVDPLQVIAKNHDLTLFSRVLEYEPSILDELLYIDHVCLEYGGIITIYPMEELPYLRVLMTRNAQVDRWGDFLNRHNRAIERVREAIRLRGALSSKDIEPGEKHKTSWWSGKDTGRALYYLWVTGELLVKNRIGTNKVFDLRERLVLPKYSHKVDESIADDYFALKTFHRMNIITAREWRIRFAGQIERKVDQDEAMRRLSMLESRGVIQKVSLEQDEHEPRFVLTEDIPLLESLIEGRIPDAWQPIETTTEQETSFLAPLDIVSARGRAARIFDFDYVWEVYKPPKQRRWGYYTLPVLFGDHLVARFDSKLDRGRCSLLVRGFWLEDNQKLDRKFTAALRGGFRRFLNFLNADRIECQPGVDQSVRSVLEKIS